MPTTSVYALRYQALTDAPNGATLGQNLAEDVEDELVRIDADVVDVNADVTALTTAVDDERPRIATADQSDVSSSTTLQSDAVLTAAVLANTNYGFDVLIKYTASATADFAYGFAIPLGSTLDWTATKLSPGDVLEQIHASGLTSSDQLNTAGGGGTSTPRFMMLRGTIRTTATGGNLTFRFAKASSEATQATRRAGSWLQIRPAR